MKKIPTLFDRDWDAPRHPVIPVINPECEWALTEGIPTRKFDGTCMLYEGGDFWKARREVKPGKDAPLDFEELELDPETGKRVGWVPVTDSWSFLRPFMDALNRNEDRRFTPGKTYELIGPKINGNPEQLAHHELELHGAVLLTDVPEPITFERMRLYFETYRHEGIVWYGRNGKMAKLKVRDFNYDGYEAKVRNFGPDSQLARKGYRNARR